MGMKRERWRAVASLVSVLCLLGVAVAQDATGVSGSGEVTNGTGERASIRLVRSVAIRADGRASGELELRQLVRDASNGAWSEFVTRESVACGSVHGNRAWVGTVVTASTNPRLPRGRTEAVWYFEDNGGDGEYPDRISALHVQADGGAAACADEETQAELADSAAPLLRGQFEVRD
jgi:hypothetical protein